MWPRGPPAGPATRGRQPRHRGQNPAPWRCGDSILPCSSAGNRNRRVCGRQREKSGHNWPKRRRPRRSPRAASPAAQKPEGQPRKDRKMDKLKVVLVVLKKTLESPLDCKEIQQVHSQGDQPWDFFGGNDAKAETPVLWPPHVKS